MWRRTAACGNRKTDVDKAAVPERRRENRKTARQGPDRRKNCLRFAKSCSTIRARRIKGGTWRAGTSPRPYAGDATSHTAELLRHAHYTGNPRFLQEGNSRSWACVLYQGCAGSSYLHSPFVRLNGNRPGAGTVPPLRASVEESRPRSGRNTATEVWGEEIRRWTKCRKLGFLRPYWRWRSA